MDPVKGGRSDARRNFIEACIAKHFKRDLTGNRALSGIKILDVGCGGGLMSEPLALLGADVVGVDATSRNIEIAKRHSHQTALYIDYRHGTADTALTAGELFDVVLNLEVIEHVDDPRKLIKDCTGRLKPGGIFIVATLNRTLRSLVLAIMAFPFGTPGRPDEPAVHLTFDDAAAYCVWAGKRLPRDTEWVRAAFTEFRPAPPPPFRTGVTYAYPTGDNPMGANCLNDCGPTPAIDYSARLDRGVGHAPAGSTRPGVNGLYDMGANVWEWTEDGGKDEKRTRGGSWWYGAFRMKADDVSTKPKDIAVVYIGFRCARDLK